MVQPRGSIIAVRTGLAASIRRSLATLIFGYDGFLSHAHADGRAYASALWTELERVGLTICFDQNDFHAGERLHVKVRRTVASSRCLIVIETPAARERPVIADEVRGALQARRPVIRIVDPRDHGTSWPPDIAQAFAAANFIRLDETLASLGAGSVSAGVAAGIANSVSGRTVRRRLTQAIGLAVFLLVAIGSAFLVNRWTQLTLQALSGQLQDPGVPLRDAFDDLEAFLTNPLYPMADTFYRPAVDALLDRAFTLGIKVDRHDDPFEQVCASVDGCSMAARTGTTFTVSGLTAATCALSSAGKIAAYGISGNGEVLVTIADGTLRAWRVEDCTKPIAEADLGGLGFENADVADVILNHPGDRVLLTGADHASVVAIDTGAGAFSLTSSLTRGALGEATKRKLGEAMPAIAGASLSPLLGTRVALSVGTSKEERPEGLCFASEKLEITDCLLLEVKELAFDHSGHYVVTLDANDMLQVWTTEPDTRTTKPSEGYEPVARFSRRLIRARLQSNPAVTMACAAPGIVATEATPEGVEAVAAFDLPTLNNLGRFPLVQDSNRPIIGVVRHPGYRRPDPLLPVVAAPIAASCGDRPFAEVPDSGGIKKWALGDEAHRTQFDLSAIVRVPPEARLEAASFSADCAKVAVALRTGPESVVAVIDVERASRQERALIGRRAVGSHVLGLDLRRVEEGWVTAAIRTDGTSVSEVRQEVPIQRQAFLRWLEEADHDVESGFALVRRGLGRVCSAAMP